MARRRRHSVDPFNTDLHTKYMVHMKILSTLLSLCKMNTYEYETGWGKGLPVWELSGRRPWLLPNGRLCHGKKTRIREYNDDDNDDMLFTNASSLHVWMWNVLKQNVCILPTDALGWQEWLLTGDAPAHITIQCSVPLTRNVLSKCNKVLSSLCFMKIKMAASCYGATASHFQVF